MDEVWRWEQHCCECCTDAWKVILIGLSLVDLSSNLSRFFN